MIGRSILALMLALPAAAAMAQTAQTAPAQPSQTSEPQTTAPQTPAPAAAPAKAGLSLAEFQARREKALMKADTDGDGKISLAEWSAFQAKRNAKTDSAKTDSVKADPAKTFARLDANKDGFLDKGELDAFFAKRFARLDANKDGALARDERPGHKSAAKPAQ
ncbi:acid-shock protein [Labrys sp. LIt4]|uniref:EF-hand domain-containing protein n=1 Tax=Labrys sp. LIt4 TaxID=2821355 RepID=UPI001ADF344B|nr:acid-shock protein [Labrys sp. LIt4]MBP0579755.1 acid-shock protein [Labrys sp. LIt4]